MIETLLKEESQAKISVVPNNNIIDVPSVRVPVAPPAQVLTLTRQMPASTPTAKPVVNVKAQLARLEKLPQAEQALLARLVQRRLAVAGQAGAVPLASNSASASRRPIITLGSIFKVAAVSLGAVASVGIAAASLGAQAAGAIIRRSTEGVD